MSRHLWSVLCQSVITDIETNNVSYINAIEEITALQLPAPMLPLMVGTLWRQEMPKDSLEVRVRFFGPGGEQLAANTFGPQAFEKDRWRLNFGFGGMQLKTPGEYSFSIEHKVGNEWREVSRLPLLVKVASQVPAGRPEVAGATNS